MSIVRIGLGEDDAFANGYEAIFGKKKPQEPKPETAAEQKPEEKQAEEKQ